MPEEKEKPDGIPLLRIILGGLFWLVLGVILGITFLSSKQPKSIISSDDFYASAPEGAGMFHTNSEVRYFRGQTMRHRVEALIKKIFTSDSNRIELTADDLDNWAESQFRGSNFEEKPEDGAMISVVPEAPNFILKNGLLYGGMQNQVTIFGQARKIRLQVIGSFHNKNGIPTWRSELIYLNSAKIPFPSLVTTFSKKMIVDAITQEEDLEKIRSAWGIIDSIEIGEKSMVVVRK